MTDEFLVNTGLLSGSMDDDIKKNDFEIEDKARYQKITGYNCSDSNVTAGIKYFP
ncbi:MAG: hypothetical protein ABI763_04150 [Bacteroidota bacterium]